MSELWVNKSNSSTLETAEPNQKKNGLSFSLFKGSIRFKLLLIVLLPMLVLLPLLLSIATYRWTSKLDNLLISKVNGDLTIAHQYLSRILENSGEKIKAVGTSASFQQKVQGEILTEVTDYLEESRKSLGFDFLYLITAEGNIITSSSQKVSRELNTKWPVILSALKGTASSHIDIFSQNELASLSPDLAKRARIDLIPTQAAIPTKRTVETRGMFVHSATPVQIKGETAALVGGILLNKNLKFIDTINDLVYQKASLPKGSQGTATLFLDDVRVSTNVRLFENQRALGTRVSAIVRSTVLGQGQVWLDRAFVVNDWYISAYEPITDSFGNRVGMLYVGFTERPFLIEKYKTLLFLFSVFFLVTLISVPIFLHWVRGIFKPVEHMAQTISNVESGNMSARTSPVYSQDEIGKVAKHLDDLLNLLEERDKQLRNWAEELNEAVEERTKELKTANQQLEATTQQLVLSEKLAAIGEITAGVAHEINNPVAVIQGNFDLIRDSLGPDKEGLLTEFRLIDEQIHSINLIVNKLLQFARPEEFSVFQGKQFVDDVLKDCLLLVQHLTNKTEIEIHHTPLATSHVLANRTELQQVFINLILNAIHAMPNGGKLTLETLDTEYEGLKGVCIKISDTGTGMSEAILSRVFDPFFTTKQSEGTGLGLSISQTLISRMGGTIQAESVEGNGTTFSIWIPYNF